MNTRRNATLPIVVSCLALTALSAKADVTTTKTTTTYSSTPSQSTTTYSTTPSLSTTISTIDLVPTGQYVIVDPLVGLLPGSYDPVTRMFNGQPLQCGVVVIDKQTNRVIATVDSAGRIVDVTTSPATEALITAVHARSDELRRIIADGLARGVLSASQAGGWQAKLDRIAADEELYKQSGNFLTYSEALQVAYSLNGLQDEVLPFVHTSFSTPTVAARFIVSNGQILMLDDFDYSKSMVERRIDDEYKGGRLSAKQVASLKEELNDINSSETKFTKEGKISESKSKILSTRLDKVKTHLDEDVASINEKRSKIGIRVD
jgi:hypothetical protein